MFDEHDSRSVKRSVSPPRRPVRSITLNDNKNIIQKTDFKNDNVIQKTHSKNDNNNEGKINNLILREWQIEWSRRACEILLNNHFYIDTSPMRSGKTFVSLQIAKHFGFELMVICPLTTKNYWKNMANKYDVKLFTDPINYEALVRGTNNEIVKNYLDRKDNKQNTFFEASPKYIEVLKTRKILLICDEGQMIKNNTLQHKACNALIKPIIKEGGQSRFGILSGTLIDKPEQIVNLFRTIGYIKSPKLYNKEKGKVNVTLTGIKELINVCKEVDSISTTGFLIKNPIPTTTGKQLKDDMNEFCFSLYVDVIKPRVSGAMTSPTTAIGELYVRNGYYNILPEKAKQLKFALNQLKYNSGYQRRSKSEDEDEVTPTNPSYITSLVQIERSKLFDMARVTKKTLTEEPTSKVIIVINYTGSETKNLSELLGYLTEYNPLVITGKTPVKKRDTIIEEFNSNPNKRILIANPKPISVGISLSDNIGNSPRYMFISPSSKLMEIVQLSSRIYSDQLKTDANVIIFYGISEDNLEANILQFLGTKNTKCHNIDKNIKDILEKKSDILDKMSEAEIRKNLILPSDYEDEYEENEYY